MQRWPEKLNIAVARSAAAASRSALRSTIAAFDPPSSAWTGRARWPAAAMIARPTGTDPVKDSRSRSPCSIIARPVSAPPVSRATVSARPASSRLCIEHPGEDRAGEGGLPQDHVAIGDGGGELADGDGERVVPRGDDADAADRAVRHGARIVGFVSRDGDDALGKEGETVGNFGLGIGNRLGDGIDQRLDKAVARGGQSAMPGGQATGPLRKCQGAVLCPDSMY